MKCKLADIAEFNPKETIKKGTVAKKIAMDKLRPFCRDIPEYELAPFTGGAKFRNGDTIMARITPCLENGKTAKVNVLETGEVGFGSTEFLVFRANKNITDEDYLYYLVCSPIVRDIAIKSMIGSSGRQRVQTDVVQNIEIDLPSLGNQKRIGNLLRSLDDKIELNNKINANLEQQAQALFKAWFVDNPDISSWQEATFADLVERAVGGDWGKDLPSGNNKEMVYCIRGADIPEVRVGNKGKMPTRYILPKNYAAKKLMDGDIVVEISGGSPTQSTGRAAVVSAALLSRYDKGMVCSNFCKALKPIAGFSMYVYYYWQHLYDTGVFFSYENGTTGIKNLDIKGFLETEPISIAPAELVRRFDRFVRPLFSEVYANGLENERLALTRDTLLPYLMSESDMSELLGE